MKIRITRHVEKDYDPIFYFEIGTPYKSWFGFGKEKIKWRRPNFRFIENNSPHHLKGINNPWCGWPFRTAEGAEAGAQAYLKKEIPSKQVVKEFDV